MMKTTPMDIEHRLDYLEERMKNDILGLEGQPGWRKAQESLGRRLGVTDRYIRYLRKGDRIRKGKLRQVRPSTGLLLKINRMYNYEHRKTNEVR